VKEAGVKNCYGIVGDTSNTFATSLSKCGIEFVHVRHEEAGAFAAQGEALRLDRLTAVAGSCGPGSLHFINGLYEANRNRAPVILIASQIVAERIGLRVHSGGRLQSRSYKGCSVFCEMVLTPEQARRLTVAACQAAITRRGVAVLILPVDVADSDAADELPYSVHVNKPVIRPNDADLDEMAPPHCGGLECHDLRWLRLLRMRTTKSSCSPSDCRHRSHIPRGAKTRLSTITRTMSA